MKILSAAVGLGVCALAVSAWADVPPPNSSQCQSMDAGVACTTDSNMAGTCQSSTCSSLAYYSDGGRGTSSYACLICTAPDAGSPDAGGGYTYYPPPASDGGTAGTDAGTASKDSGGCASSSTTNLLGPICLALLPLLLLRRRRS